MSSIEKIKRTVLVVLGFALATYLIMSGVAILNKDSNTTSEIQEIK